MSPKFLTGYGIRTPLSKASLKVAFHFPALRMRGEREEIPDHNEIDNDVTKHNNGKYNKTEELNLNILNMENPKLYRPI